MTISRNFPITRPVPYTLENEEDLLLR